MSPGKAPFENPIVNGCYPLTQSQGFPDQILDLLEHRSRQALRTKADMVGRFFRRETAIDLVRGEMQLPTAADLTSTLLVGPDGKPLKRTPDAHDDD